LIHFYKRFKNYVQELLKIKLQYRL